MDWYEQKLLKGENPNILKYERELSSIIAAMKDGENDEENHEEKGEDEKKEEDEGKDENDELATSRAMIETLEKGNKSKPRIIKIKSVRLNTLNETKTPTTTKPKVKGVESTKNESGNSGNNNLGKLGEKALQGLLSRTVTIQLQSSRQIKDQLELMMQETAENKKSQDERLLEIEHTLAQTMSQTEFNKEKVRIEKDHMSESDEFNGEKTEEERWIENRVDYLVKKKLEMISRGKINQTGGSSINSAAEVEVETERTDCITK